MAAGHKKASISKIESNIAGESIPLMFGVLPRDNCKEKSIGKLSERKLEKCAFSSLGAAKFVVLLGIYCVSFNNLHFYEVLAPGWEEQSV